MKLKPGMPYDEIVKGLVRDVRMLQVACIAMAAGMCILALVVFGLVLAA
jgi:hypothetical protein